VNRVRKIEKELERLGTERKVIEARLSSDAFYSQPDQDEVAAAMRDQGKLATVIETLESEWLNLQNQLEAAERDDTVAAR
jgi:ATP-binding cassette, subfamily F, member 3